MNTVDKCNVMYFHTNKLKKKKLVVTTNYQNDVRHWELKRLTSGTTMTPKQKKKKKKDELKKNKKRKTKNEKKKTERKERKEIRTFVNKISR